jgi:hypothetical protein
MATNDNDNNLLVDDVTADHAAFELSEGVLELVDRMVGCEHERDHTRRSSAMGTVILCHALARWIRYSAPSEECQGVLDKVARMVQMSYDNTSSGDGSTEPSVH